MKIKMCLLAGLLSHFWPKQRSSATFLIYLLTLCCTVLTPANANDGRATSLIALGKTLFFSKTLSANHDIACATCHDPAHAYADGRAVAMGHLNQRGQRNTPSLLNATKYTRWSWDGHNQLLETQVLEPLFSTREHGLANERHALAIIRDTPLLASQYVRAFGNDATFNIDNIAHALAAYVREIGNTVATPTTTSSAQIEHGRKLFMGIAACAICHDPASGFTDNFFHLGYQGAPDETEATRAAINRLRLKTATSKYQRNSHDATAASLGVFAATLNPDDIGKFRTPSLRHIARTAPYMHDGNVATLREAIQIEIKMRAPHVKFSAEEVDALAAYLATL